MQVKLMSILLDPRPERRNDLMADLVRHGIELHYLIITNDGAYTVVKGLAPDSQAALEVLQQEGYTVFLHDILGVGTVRGYPSLMKVFEVLDQQQIVIDQCHWVYSPVIGPVVLLAGKDLAAGKRLLAEVGYRVLDEAALCQ